MLIIHCKKRALSVKNIFAWAYFLLGFKLWCLCFQCDEVLRQNGPWLKSVCRKQISCGYFFPDFWGVGIAQWLECRTRDRKVVGSNPCWSGGRIFFSRVNFLCWLLFRYPFHPRVTAVARKRPRSSCQKRRWQVTAKHAYTLRMWLCMKWHGAWLYGVHRTRRDWLSLAADSCGTSHASAVSTPLRCIFKNAL